MKTKTKAQSKILIVCATLLCFAISFTSYAQTALDLSDFHGTWAGADKDGNTVTITLTDKWGCTFTVNGSPLHSGNAIVAYRLPQYSPQVLPNNGPPSPSEIVIKFFTQGAMTGARVPAASSTNSNASTITDNLVEQIYTGLAVITTNSSGLMEMALYSDVNNFSSVAPQIDPLDSTPYCTLIKQ